MVDGPAIVAFIANHKIDLSHEKVAQADFANALKADGIAFEREKRLSDRDIVDFLIDGVAIEFKMKRARKRAIYHQLCRYAQHDAVHALVLVSNISMGLPQEIGGKPAYYASLGRAWL